MVVHEEGHHLRVMDIGRREDECRERFPFREAGMKLEAIVPALVILAEVRYLFRYFVRI
jgi:hypothetical protein